MGTNRLLPHTDRVFRIPCSRFDTDSSCQRFDCDCDHRRVAPADKLHVRGLATIKVKCE